ncbi:hypothetical protein EDE05_108205 [Neorhizobium sp. R1-B]|uniref:hypothetical protein n=1 Tax=unclassified Neorhizobium TaxID=2629175 RepID=UPI000DD89E72|nr:MULTISPECIES: hypothetical protein [unclassified Neorhizobium]TCV71315.1 hypothetical protein EDE09_10618 [Neorhizobium sp. S3-V5DH]TDX82528.1 hypothetical protein EDE05_108205 [Neorhizobium sp. R1-B]
MSERQGAYSPEKTVLAVVWGVYDTLKWCSERNPHAPPQRVVLLDPIGSKSAALSSLSKSDIEIIHIAGIPSDKDGQTEIFSHTHPKIFSSARTTTALQSLFPGLRVKGVAAADYISTESLSSVLGREDETFALVVETPGAELSILKYLEESGFLARVTTIHLRCGKDIFFEHASDEAQIREWLKAHFFYLLDRRGEDPDWPQLAFAADLNGRRIPALEARIDGMTKALAELEKSLKAEQERVAAHKAVASQAQSSLRENEEALARARGDYARARHEMSLMLESLRVTQGDLKDLRGRYASVFDEKRQLEELIRKLTPRLREAAGQLRELFAPAPKDAAHTEPAADQG